MTTTITQTDNTQYLRADPFTGDIYATPRTTTEQADSMVLLHMVAEFPRVKDATRFRETYLNGGKSFEANVTQASRIVRWDGLLHDTGRRVSEYVCDLLENAGWIGGTRAMVGFSRTDPAPTAKIRAPHIY
jgi:hypothetical protein